MYKTRNEQGDVAMRAADALKQVHCARPMKQRNEYETADNVLGARYGVDLRRLSRSQLELIFQMYGRVDVLLVEEPVVAQRVLRRTVSR